ncbi:hypothetical protein JCM13664_01480 [Methylothermus subterraneus]
MYEAFLLKNPSEIARILRALLEQRALISAQIESEHASFITALLLVDLERQRIALDYGPDPRLNGRALAAKKVFCQTKLDRLEVKFTASHLTEAKLQGQPVFCARFPETLYYPQKRRFYRLILPKTSPLSCTVGLPDGTTLALEVIDLGVGGLGLFDREGHAPLSVGGICPNCRLHLPGLGEVVFDLEVRSVLELNPGKRIGGAFLNLKPAYAAWIQRYLNQEQIKLRQRTPERP